MNKNQNSNQNQTNTYTNLYQPYHTQNQIPEQNQISRQGGHQQYYQPMPSAPPKQPFSPIPLLLIAGVLFLFMGGIVFLTSTWEILPDAGRAIGLLSASVIAFGVNILAERVLKLPKTGLAFYILGCIFLPLALGGIGVFQLFGEWLSFYGDGALLLWTIIFVSVSGTTFLGQRNYKHTTLVWMSLGGLTGAWTCFSKFLADQIFPVSSANSVMAGILFVLFSGMATVLTELYLKKHTESYVTKAIPSFLYVTNLFYACLIHGIALDVPVAGCIFALIMFALFCNYQFISNTFHAGVIGACVSLFTASYSITKFFPDVKVLEIICFVPACMAVIFISFWNMPKLRTELTKTFSTAGAVLSFPILIIGGCYNIWNFKSMIVIYALVFIAFLFYAKDLRATFTHGRSLFVLSCGMLFTTAVLASSAESSLLSLLLVISALVLLMQSFLKKTISTLVLAISASSAMILLNLPHSEITLLWLSVIFLLAGVVYANKSYRFLLEACCAWAGIAVLIPACYKTCSIWLESDIAWILSFVVMTLLYLAEAFLFRGEIRPNRTKPYLETVSLLISIIACIAYFIEGEAGAGFLLWLGLLVFSARFCKKNHNAIAIPQLVMLFFVFAQITNQLITESSVLKVICYLMMLAVYAVMGRVLLPDGFCTVQNGKTQIDWALLAGIFPIFGIAFVIDWYPSILICLFLALYSVLYIGRVKNQYMPSLMASAFSCLTIFFHNINDAFGILQVWHETDMKIPKIILDLLPLHLFILSLIWILPRKNRETIYKIRFGMYCFTTFCMLAASLNFGNVTDAIILAIFSFLILLSSFTMKKLRWFTLGFSVLFMMTIKLTWQFWTSLHWGVYLFLAGIVLIILASLYEYSSRKASEHADEPKQKFKPFASWTW